MHVAEFRTADGVPFMNLAGPIWELQKTTGGFEVIEHNQWQMNMHYSGQNGQFSSAGYIYAGHSTKRREMLFSSKAAAHAHAADLAMEQAKAHMSQAH